MEHFFSFSWHTFTLVLLYSFLGCISMAAQDFSGTLLTVAEARNKSKEAKWLDRAGDLAKFVMLCYSGTNLMKLGLLGWLGIIPILWVGGIVTQKSTEFANERYGPTSGTCCPHCPHAATKGEISSRG